MSWFSQQWNRFANPTQEEDGEEQPIKRVEVVWGRERLTIPIDEQAPKQATLRDLKERIAHLTSIPYEQVKLIKGGLVLKDDKCPLAGYNIRTGSRLQLLGTSGGAPIYGDRPGAKSSVFDMEAGTGKMSRGEEMARRKKEREEDISEAGLMQRIEETVSSVRRDIVPELLEFERVPQQMGDAPATATAVPSGAGEAAHPSTGDRQAQLSKQQKKLSELLLRALLALDGVNVNTDATRKSRKEAVKEVQSYLDRVDAAWTQIKAHLEGSNTSTAQPST